jgi:hypothetical protein
VARRTRIHLHARDLAILEELVVRRADTLEQLHARHFPGLSRKRAINRLGDLTAHGYLRRVPLPDGAGRIRNTYTLGPKAPAALRLRSLAGEHLRGRRLNPSLPETSIPHQLAINRVADALRTPLLPEHLLDVRAGVERRHRPDAAYRCRRDERGRDLVFVEVDLGHYSRARVRAKVQTFLEHPEARAILFATPDAARADEVARWIRDSHGAAVMGRVQVLTFAELEGGGRLDPGTDPADAPTGVPG